MQKGEGEKARYGQEAWLLGLGRKWGLGQKIGTGIGAGIAAGAEAGGGRGLGAGGNSFLAGLRRGGVEGAAGMMGGCDRSVVCPLSFSRAPRDAPLAESLAFQGPWPSYCARWLPPPVPQETSSPAPGPPPPLGVAEHPLLLGLVQVLAGSFHLLLSKARRTGHESKQHVRNRWKAVTFHFLSPPWKNTHFCL